MLSNRSNHRIRGYHVEIAYDFVERLLCAWVVWLTSRHNKVLQFGPSGVVEARCDGGRLQKRNSSEYGKLVCSGRKSVVDGGED